MSNNVEKPHAFDGSSTIYYYDEKISTPQMHGVLSQIQGYDQCCDEILKSDSGCPTNKMEDLKFYCDFCTSSIKANKNQSDETEISNLASLMDVVKKWLIPTLLHINDNLDMNVHLSAIEMIENALDDNPILREIILNVLDKQKVVLEYSRNEYENTFYHELESQEYLESVKHKSKHIQELFSMLEKILIGVVDRDLELDYYKCMDKALKATFEDKDIAKSQPAVFKKGFVITNSIYFAFLKKFNIKRGSMTWKLEGNLDTKIQELRDRYRNVMLSRVLELLQNQDYTFENKNLQNCSEIVKLLEPENPFLHEIINRLINNLDPFENFRDFTEHIPKTYDYLKSVRGESSLARNLVFLIEQEEN